MGLITKAWRQENMGFNTSLLHQAATGDKVTGATLTPVYQSSAFYQPSAKQHEKYPLMKDYKKFGKFAYTAKLRNGLFRNTGACLAPQTAFYNLIGMETLGLRMERACKNAMNLAKYIDSIDGIIVNYPGLESSKWHEKADKVLKNGYGTILTIRVGSKERAFDIMDRLTIPLIVSNIGDTKTLIVHPESTLSVHSTPKEKEDADVYDDLIRISVGIEDIEDLIKDFDNAINNNQ